MKAASQARRSSGQSGSTRAAASRIQRKARPGGAGNHRRQRNDSLERQADELAGRIMRGESNVARHITPTAPASFRLSGSRGTPLPQALREKMEGAFGANLGAVRIHTDTAAATAVSENQADAFASGSDIYFRPDRYRPHSEAGRQLIAHELTHVLQQTGRAGIDGRVHATSVFGSGEIQCFPPAGTTEEGAFSLLEQRFQARSNQPDLQSTIDEIRPLLGGRLAPNQPAFAQSFVDAVRARTFQTRSGDARGFALDCLKLMGFFEEATALIDADNRFEIRVGTAQLDFIQHLDAAPRGPAWAGESLRLPAFANFWPNPIVRAYRDFFLQPHSPPPSQLRTLDARFQTEVARRVGLDTSSELVPQERVMLGWVILRNIDLRRIEVCREAQSQSGGTTAQITATEVRLRVLQNLLQFEQTVIDDDQQPAFRRLLAERLVAMALQILPQLETTVANYTTWQARFEHFTDAELLQAPAGNFPHSALTDSFLAGLRSVLVAQSGVLLALEEIEGDEPRMPSEADYAARLGAWRQALVQPDLASRGRAGRPGLFPQLDAALVSATSAGRPNRETIAALGLLSMILDRLVQLTLNYDEAADTATPTFADERAGHRIRVARSLSWLARWMQWSDLLDVCRPALTADASDEVQLWLLSNWEAEDRQPIDRLAQDFPANLNRPILRDSPLTVRHLVEWFHLDYNTRLRAVLTELVAPEALATARTQVPIERINALQQSRAEVASVLAGGPDAERAAQAAGVPPALFDLRLPQRFTVRAWEVSIPPGRSFEWDAVIENHEKTRLSLERHRSDGAYTALLFPTTPTQGVFAWMTPSLRPLIELLRTVPSLNRVAGRAPLTDEQWLFNLAPEQLTEEQWRRINEQLQHNLEVRNERVTEDLPQLWLRLNILRRRILVMQLHPRLEAYVANPSVAFGPIGETQAQERSRLQTLADTLAAIYAYEGTVVPPESKDVQVALLIIQLADVLDGTVTSHRPEAEFGRGIYPYLVSTLAWLDGDAEKLHELRRATNTYDEAGNIVYIDRNARTAKTHLLNLKQAIDETYREAQNSIGFGSEDGRTIVPNGFATPIYPSHRADDEHQWTVGGRGDADFQSDTSTGTAYRLLEVFRRFTYHPSVGSPGSSESPGLPARYIDDAGVEFPHVNETGEIVPIPHVPLFRLEIGGVPHEVHADEGVLLSSLYEIFLWRSVGLQMQNLGAMTEAYLQWVITVVSILVPEVAAAEIAASVAQLVVSGEIEEIVRQLRDDPGEILNRLVERLRDELFTPENVWRFVLLGGQHNPFAALDGVLPNRQRRPTTVRPASRLGRIANHLRTIGRQVRLALHRLQLYADGPIRSVQGNIAMRPTLAWMLRRAAHLFEAAADLIPPEVLDSVARAELPRTPQELIDAAGEGIADAGRDMEANTARLLETIAHFELPHELLELPAVTELIIGFIVDRFGPRARAARLVLNIIPIPQEHEGRFTGLRTLYQFICAEIARVWRDSPIDPNVYWRSKMIPLIGTKFTETRDDLVDGLYTALDRFLHQIGRPNLPRPTALPETQVEAVQTEVEPSLSERRLGTGGGRWRVPSRGGDALSAGLSRPLERGFGQQFSHVRLHRGAEGRAATEPVGADAVTSGSHVFVHPSRPLSGAAGRHLLAHELTHVVQQTGSHPLGGRSSPIVRAGRANRGLRIDPSREAQAEQAATRIVAGRRPPKLSAAVPPDGPQPALSERTVNSVIDTITTAKRSSDFTATPHGGTASHVPGIETARQLWTRLKELVETMTFAPFLHVPGGTSVPNVANTDLPAIIKAQLRERQEELIGQHIAGIAQLAQRPKRNRQPNDPETELSSARFVNLLEDFIAAERGIALTMEFDATTSTLGSIRAINVLLHNVGGTSALWRIVMHRSFSGHSADVPDLARAQGEIRQRLRALGPSPAVFSPLSFEFSEIFVRDYLDLLRSRGRSVDDIPNVHDYTTPGNNRADSLAVSTHGDFTSRGIGAFARESHHTTQYLLVEFFGNLPEASRSAFPSHHAQYPSGVEFKNGSQGELTGIRSGARFLNVGALNPDRGRGNNMPAILLAARTHQRGELHVLREARWDAGTDYAAERLGTTTQGFAIENKFNGFLRAELRPHGNSESHRTAFNEAIQRDEPRANREFYNAAVATYHWMYDRMIPALRRGLETEELAYYRGVAAINHKRSPDSDELQAEWDMRPDQLTPVWRAAKANNDHVMTAAGWPTP
jgi:hypothetical protein